MRLGTRISKGLALYHVPYDFIRHCADESHQCHLSSYSALRKAYLWSHGRSRRAFGALYRRMRPVSHRRDEHDEILGRLRRDGIVVVPGFLPERTIVAMRNHLQAQPGYRPTTDFRAAPDRLDTTVGIRLQYTPETVLVTPGVAQLLATPFFQEVAASYFGSVPIFTSLLAWWSLPNTNATEEDLSWAAQKFHFDYDWPLFLKFFIYLTDVHLENGPFTYVRGTHERKREWRDGRIDDDYINAVYGERVTHVCGSSGDLIIADTAGYHKGQRATEGRRLILQFEFAVSRFGSSGRYGLLPRRFRPQGLWPKTFDVFSG